MKQCPTCNQTYTDTQMFCAADGSKLIEQVAPQLATPSPAAEAYYQSPPQFVRATQPAKSSWLAVISVVLGSIACALLIYFSAQALLSPFAFRREFVSLATLGFSGIALGLGVPLTVLSVLTGVTALVLSFVKRERFGGRVPAIVGPVICVLACVLALGLFTFRRLQGPIRFWPIETDSPGSNSNSSPRTVLPSSSSMTNEEKYRLFWAATKTDDKFLQVEAAKKIGVIDGSGRPTPSYQEFVRNATSWAVNDVAFIRSVDTPSKARTYVNAHMDY